MNLVALVLNSSILCGGRFIKLSVNRSGSMAEIRWCIAISGFKFLIPIHTLLNLSMKVLNDSPFSCLTWRRDMDDVRWGLLVAYWVINFISNISKLSTEFSGSSVNHPRGPSLSEVGNTLHHTVWSTVYNVICVLKMFKCSSGSVEPSYRFIVKPLHLSGRGVAMISSEKGWPLGFADLRGVTLLTLWWVCCVGEVWRTTWVRVCGVVIFVPDGWGGGVGAWNVLPSRSLRAVGATCCSVLSVEPFLLLVGAVLPHSVSGCSLFLQ